MVEDCLDRKCPSQVGYVYDGPVCCQVRSVSIASFSRKYSNIVGQARKCDRQAVKIHDRMVSKWVETESGYRVMEG